MMDQAGRRRQVLLAWAFVQRNRGEAVPTNEDLIQIAMARTVPPGLRTPLANRWAHVLHHLMWLSDQGHPDPVKDALQMAPAGPPIPGPRPAPQHFGPSHQPSAARPPSVQPSAVQPSPADFPQGAPSQQRGFSASVQRVIQQLNQEIDVATERARQALAQGRDDLAGPQLVRRNTLRQRLARIVRGEDPGEVSAASAASATGMPSADAPEQFERVGAAADAVPPPPSHEPDQGTAAPPPFPAQLHQTQESATEHTAPLHLERTPAPPAASPQSEDPLQRLMMWRNTEGIDELKDRHLRQIVNSGARTVDEVAASLPASLKPLAGRIGAVLGLAEPVTAPIEEQRPAPPAQAGPMGRQQEPAPRTSERLNPQALTWEQPQQLGEELNRFAAMDFSRPSGDPVPLRVAPRADGSLTLLWPEPQDSAPVRIYRVVSDDGYAPVSPDMAEVIAVTGQRTLIDPRPFSSAVRHYQVWANVGASTEDALIEQPVLVAHLPVVAKPSDIDIREDEGRVIGQWTLHGDVRRVQIFRVPVERAGGGPGNPDYRICADTPNLSGFVDDAAEPGRRYLYQLLVEAEVNGTPQLSLPTSIPVTTSAVLHPVADLACTLGDDEAQPRFDLVWTAPQSGRVVIYRTADGPRAGADAETADESALPQMGLRPEDRLAHPILAEGDRGSMRDVPWPRGWSRTYFTPVTLLDGKVRVGRTTSQVRTGTVTDARIVERVTEQVLTMDWPAGAAAIKVYASRPGQPAHEAIDGAEPIAEISEDAYVRLGGLHFTRPLDAGGCDLHLLPISFAGGHAVAGRPTTVRYRGLLKLWYDLELRRPRIGRGQVLLLVRIRSDRPNPTSPAFALIHNPDRLPLDVNDGQPIMVQYAVDQVQAPSPRFWPASLTTAPSEPGWFGDVTGRTGFVRVFVDMPRNPEMGTVALLDPPLPNLYLGGR
ncbi:PspA/IM30 family protein [Granulicoccus sp. GXG6511]|uniref:PspA/IM30 family protein n=1 Tax=Granulicoccus sp. GXG6511 TaxID=3381351 RepID=UPI003D7C58AE